MMDGGYYRADVSQNISVLVLDSMYYVKSNNSTGQMNEGQNQLEWFEE